MQSCVQQIRVLLSAKTLDDLFAEPITRAAFERFLEILSEPSRHIPPEWKSACGADIPWRRVADLGNHIRHAYNYLDVELLWSIYEDELDALEAAIERMLQHAIEQE